MRGESDVRVTIHRDRCVGHALCCSTTPEWFVLDDETGLATTRADEIPPELEAWVLAAANGCPERAIEVTS